MFISIDPGQNVGVASFKEDGTDLHSKTIDLDSFPLFLINMYQYAVKHNEKVHLLYEDFMLRQDKAIAQTGSDMPASQCIGMLKLIHAWFNGQSTLETCSSRDLITAFKWDSRPDIAAKLERRRGYHPPDHLAAHAHGVMWLINKNIRKHPIFES